MNIGNRPRVDLRILLKKGQNYIFQCLRWVHYMEHCIYLKNISWEFQGKPIPIPLPPEITRFSPTSNTLLARCWDVYKVSYLTYARACMQLFNSYFSYKVGMFVWTFCNIIKQLSQACGCHEDHLP